MQGAIAKGFARSPVKAAAHVLLSSLMSRRAERIGLPLPFALCALPRAFWSACKGVDDLVSGLFAESLHLERETVVFDKKSRQNCRRDDVF